MYTAEFKIYLEDGIETVQGKVFPKPKDTTAAIITRLVLNVGLVDNEQQLREVLRYNHSYRRDLTFDELLDTQQQRISRDQVKALEPFLREPINIATKMLYRVKEAVHAPYGTRYIWSIHDHYGTHLCAVGQNARYLPLRMIKNRTSYGWKHTAESYLHKYISNGAFIAGCILYGIPIDVNECYLNPVVRFDKVLMLRIKDIPIKG